MAGIVFRSGRSSDAQAVHRLESLSFPDPWSAASLIEELAGDGRLSMVAEHTIAPTGIVAYVLLRCLGKEAELLRIGVHPRHRRQGLGTDLVRRAGVQLAARGIARCFLEVRSDNQAALHLYDRFFAHEIARRPAYYRDGTDALVLAFATDEIAPETP